MVKKIRVKEIPEMVAMLLVKRLVVAVVMRTMKTERRPRGISRPPICRLSGTFQPRSPLYFQRRTSMAKALKVKLQMTPKA